MLKRFQTPLGLVLSYSVFHELLFSSSQSTIQFFRALITASGFIGFVSGITAKTGSTASPQAISEAVTIVNIDMVFLSLAIGFLSAALLIQVLAFLTWAYEELSNFLTISFSNACRIGDSKLSKPSTIVIEPLIQLLLIVVIFFACRNLLILVDFPFSDRFPSMGSALIYYWNQCRAYLNI